MNELEKELLECIALVDDLRARKKFVLDSTRLDSKMFGTGNTPISEIWQECGIDLSKFSGDSGVDD